MRKRRTIETTEIRVIMTSKEKGCIRKSLNSIIIIEKTVKIARQRGWIITEKKYLKTGITKKIR